MYLEDRTSGKKVVSTGIKPESASGPREKFDLNDNEP